MRTTRLFGFLVLVVTMALTSCTQDYDLDATTSTTPQTTCNNRLSQDEAVAIATDAVNSLGVQATRAGKAGRKLTVESIRRTPDRGQTRADGQDGTYFYVVNFEEGGYALVPNDKRATSVYAVSDEGNFDPDANDGVRLFMDLAETYLHAEVSGLIGDSLATTFPFKPGGGWEKRPDDDDPRNYAVVYIGGEEYYDKVTRTQSEPFYLLDTQWGQDYPYNMECFTDDGQQARTGCVATALAQIMAYHKQPQSYNGHIYYWDRMPKNRDDYDGSSEAYSVCYLMRDIGQAVSMNYGVEGSGASPTMCLFALPKFGYACDGLDDYDVSGVITSLCNDRPVYMRGKDKNTGEGHAWVADGYYYISEFHTYYSADDLSVAGNYTKVTYYLHMNWGWDGGEKNKNNGYYLSSVFNPEIFSTDTYEYIEYNYSDDLQMICNIRYAN